MKPVFSILFLLLISLMVFQNCAKTTDDTLSSSSSADNGGTYGGLVAGVYNRIVPQFTCQSGGTSSSVIASIEIFNPKDRQALMTQSQGNVCSSSTMQVPTTSFILSSYQQDLLGYQEGVYDGRPFMAGAPPASIIEMWCREATAYGLEAVVYRSRSSGQLTTVVHYVDRIEVNGGKGIIQRDVPEFPVSLNVSSTEIQVSGAQGFKILIPLVPIVTPRGNILPPPHLEGNFFGTSLNRTVECRLSGSLDPLNP